jgi:hypothetical protein
MKLSQFLSSRRFVMSLHQFPQVTSNSLNMFDNQIPCEVPHQRIFVLLDLLVESMTPITAKWGVKEGKQNKDMRNQYIVNQEIDFEVTNEM